MKSLDDTIAAISTPVGQGGIGLVRISGPDAQAVARRLFRPASQLDAQDWEPHHLKYGHIVDPQSDECVDGHIVDPQSDECVDEVLVSFMPAPHTYTRQDVVEINCHGGPVPLRKVLELVLREGARLAEPGEFTLRAFLNGRIDLAQAEAVLDVVNAQTDAGLRLAVNQLDGRLSGEIGRIRDRLLGAMAYLEATIDFVEDEIPPQDVRSDLAQCEQELAALARSADQGIIYRRGIRTAIVGRRNVGKSSLLNALLRVDRAIVTAIPGTTRDTLEETLNLDGVPIVLVDTAGIASESSDPVEQLGIERSHSALRSADLILMVVDRSQPLEEEDFHIAESTRGRPTLVVANKIDLPEVADLSLFLPEADRVFVSALTGEGLEGLKRALLEKVLGGQVLASDALLVTSARHKEALVRALDEAQAAGRTLGEGMPADFVTIHVRAALDALGEITGQTVTADLLDNIFSNFCIGK